MHKSSVGNLATVLPFRLLVALDLAKDPGGSYSIMSIALGASRLWNYADIRESGLMIALIPRMRVLFAVQVRKKVVALGPVCIIIVGVFVFVI